MRDAENKEEELTKTIFEELSLDKKFMGLLNFKKLVFEGSQSKIYSGSLFKNKVLIKKYKSLEHISNVVFKKTISRSIKNELTFYNFLKESGLNYPRIYLADRLRGLLILENLGGSDLQGEKDVVKATEILKTLHSKGYKHGDVTLKNFRKNERGYFLLDGAYSSSRAKKEDLLGDCLGFERSLKKDLIPIFLSTYFEKKSMEAYLLYKNSTRFGRNRGAGVNGCIPALGAGGL